jgi:hypothetical protein
MEATGASAEYIRDGLDYAQWLSNVNLLLQSNTVKAVHVMCTINALCLPTLPALLDQLLELKRTYGRERVNFTLNILRFPSFQSALVLPDDLRNQFRAELEAWLVANRDDTLLHEHEVNHTQRLLDYLDVVKTPHSDTFDMPKLHNDFWEFYTQYNSRRNKNFVTTFPSIARWFEQLERKK